MRDLSSSSKSEHKLITVIWFRAEWKTISTRSDRRSLGHIDPKFKFNGLLCLGQVRKGS